MIRERLNKGQSNEGYSVDLTITRLPSMYFVFLLSNSCSVQDQTGSVPWTEAGISTGYSRDVCVCHGVNGVGDRQRKEFLCFIISFCLFSFLLEQSLRIVFFLFIQIKDCHIQSKVSFKFYTGSFSSGGSRCTRGGAVRAMIINTKGRDNQMDFKRSLIVCALIF